MIGVSCWWAFADGLPKFEAARSRGPLRGLLLLLLTACGAPATRVPDYVAPWLREDPQRCLLARDLRENMEGMARRCAELFVRQNGYTDLPPAQDSTRWVPEHGEAGSWRRLLAARGGMLDQDATTVQCSMRQCIVFFRVRRTHLLCAYRLVTMSQVFTQLRLEPGGVHDVRCDERRA
jgi:hypothetical protein